MGPSSGDLSRLTDISQKQFDMGNTLFGQAQNDLRQRDALMSPLISFNQAITGGSRDARLAANAPLVSQITQARTSSQAQIRNSLPPGAARDTAIADTYRSANDQIAGANNQTYTGALSSLGQLGSSLGSFGLNETGGALNAGQAAAGTTEQVMQAKAQKKAATTSMIGSLVGTAGGFAGRALFPSNPSSPTGSGSFIPMNNTFSGGAWDTAPVPTNTYNT